MDSSELTDTGFLDQLGQELNPASSEEASTSLNGGFQHFLNDPASAMPLLPGPFGQDFSSAENLARPLAEGQAELGESFGIDFMNEDFAWMNQHDFTVWDVVSQQAEVQPGANTPWPSAPFGGDQSGLHFAQQEMPETSLIVEMPLHFLDAQPSANQPFEDGSRSTYIPATAGLSDLYRHQDAYHLQKVSYWCGHRGCERAGPGGRPFPRKDKRTEHERKIHGIEYAHPGGQ
ncbi:hypothetical protein BFW01_g11020 [Lasiodiplodia theobromae]|uniref:Uncharacterized protein n=1 Tax=Lasiodiplodia theobromae TaxID=45133 RepID=A0A8H7IQ99_9PEZI|nr:hypothetical protein BFW01_g11020 [Lasiodiplodia theobromae]